MKKRPWITEQANRFLKKIVRPDFRILEFGCGGSTLWFDKRVQTLISVEHDQSWYDQICTRLRNGKILLYPSEQIRGTDHLENPYDHVCDQYPDDYFNLVMIDGRDRVRCVEKARRIVQPSGYLCVDNMDRPIYKSIFQLLSDWKHIPTEQKNCLEAKENGIWRTDFWQKPSGVDFLFRSFPWPETKPNVAKDAHSLFSNEGPLSKLLNKKMILIVELGSWLGASTRFILNHAPNAVVIAIDHWKGSSEHRQRDYAKLRLNTLYETFLVNCWDYRERLIPIKETTLKGLAIVHHHGLKPDLFYLDASHDYESVTKDLKTIHQYFPESLIVGDDWMWGSQEDFPVRRAVSDFSEKVGFKWYAKENCWWLEKKQATLAKWFARPLKLNSHFPS